MSVIPEDPQEHWRIVQPIFFSIRAESEYDRAIEGLNAFIDEIGDNKQHPLHDLLDTLDAVIYAFEDNHYPILAY